MNYKPKTNWKYDDIVTEQDMIRIESGIGEAHEQIEQLQQGVGQEFGQLQEEVTAHKENYAKFKNEVEYNFTQGQDRPLYSTNTLIFYVSNDGSDDNDGLTKQTSFATLNRCIKEIPINLNHTFYIRIVDEFETNEAFSLVNVQGSGSIRISTMDSKYTPKISRLEFKNVSCNIHIYSLEFTAKNSYNLFFHLCGYVAIEGCYFNAVDDDWTNGSIYANGGSTFIAISRCHCNNKHVFFAANDGARVFNGNANTGENNRHIARLSNSSVWFRFKSRALPKYTVSELVSVSPPGAAVDVEN